MTRGRVDSKSIDQDHFAVLRWTVGFPVGFPLEQKHPTLLATSGCRIDANLAAKVDGGMPNPRRMGKSADHSRSSAKRPKVYVRITADILQSSSGIVTAQSVSNVISCQKTSTNAPVPLATKVYYSQRNNRLRAAINYMYHGTSRIELCKSKENLKAARGNIAACHGSSRSTPPPEQSNDHSEKVFVLSFSP
ncbi:hypothetical protein Dimus_001277 [Dionaea muscipula]